MLGRCLKKIINHPVIVLVVCLAFAFVASSGASNLIFKGDYRVFFGPDNPQRLAYESMQKVYSKNDNVAFIVAPSSGDVFTVDQLSAIRDLTEKAWMLPYSVRVDSITNFQHSRADGDDLVVDDLVPDTDHLDSNEVDKIKKIALSDPLLKGKLISKNGDVSVVNVTVGLPGINPIMEVPEVVSHARELRDLFMSQNPGVQVYLSGMVMMNAAFSESSISDSARLMPLMVWSVIVLVGLFLRTIVGTLATIVVVKLSSSITLGLAGWMGYYLTSPSAIAPTIILTLAVADCVHILSTTFYEMSKGLTKKDAVLESLKANFQPIVITSVTTAIGFLCMNLSDSPPYRDLGNLVALGVMIALILSFTLLPAILLLLPLKVRRKEKGANDLFERLSMFVVGRRKAIFPIVTLLIVSGIFNISKNELNDDYVKYFDQSVPFRVATDFMADNVSGMTFLDISVDSGKEYGISDVKYTEVLEMFTVWLRSQPETDHVNSIVDILKRINMNMHGDDPQEYKIPLSRDINSQYLLMYEMSLPYGLDLNNQVNIDKSATRVSATFDNLTTNQILDLERRIHNWFHVNGEGFIVEVTGPSLMFAHIGERSIDSLIKGMLLALVLISVLIGVVLKSVKYGVVSLFANLMPIGVGFGFWGIVDGQIGIALAVVAGMTLGIVVDDTVHFISKYARARREAGLSPTDSIHRAFSSVGLALSITTVVLVIGFSILAQSSFKTNSDMGLLTAITLVVALVIDFFFVPPLLLMIDKKVVHRKAMTNEFEGGKV